MSSRRLYGQFTEPRPLMLSSQNQSNTLKKPEKNAFRTESARKLAHFGRRMGIHGVIPLNYSGSKWLR